MGLVSTRAALLLSPALLPALVSAPADYTTLSSVEMLIFSLHPLLSLLPHSGCFISGCFLTRLAAREEVEKGPAFPSSLGGQQQQQSGPVIAFYDPSQP